MKEKSVELKKLEKQLKVSIETPYDHGDKVSKVKFRFSKKVWADLANKEGKLLPSCCGNVSAIRDELITAMREDGWIDAQSMQNIVVNMAGHDYEPEHPVGRIKIVYDVLEAYLECRKISSVDLNNVDAAVSRVWFGDIWQFCSSYGCDSMYSGWGENAQQRATHNLRLHDIMPTIKTLYEYLQETKFGPADAVALVRKASNELYEFYGRGLALFPNIEMASKTLDSWIKTGQVKPEDAEIRNVRISLEKGVEFIEDIEHPWGIKPEIDQEQVDKIWGKINELRSENDEKYKNDKIEAILSQVLQELRS